MSVWHLTLNFPPIVNMDGGVGGSWKEVEYVEVGGQKIPTQQQLQQSEAQPIDLK